MINQFFFIGLPYIALFALVVVTAYRFRARSFTYTALSSQFLESKQLLWGSLPWHVGILIVFIGHLIPFLMPGLWQNLTSRFAFVIAVEVIGVVAAFTALAGLTLLLIRRVLSRHIQAVTTPVDLIVLALLITQVLVGIQTAAGHRWGSMWSTQTTTPYLWSLLTLQPDLSYVEPLRPTVKLHIALAWVIVLLFPFSRLVHALSIPIHYLWRAPQQVIWTNARRIRNVRPVLRSREESRRLFLKGAMGLSAAGGLLTVGVMDKLVRFFSGPQMTTEEQATLLRKRLQRLEMTAEERELELERMRNDYIFVANLKELSPKDGKYFIDFQMRPALAFRDETGMPLLISAKCTHLGCTVASTIDTSGRVLCPCHMSYFDAKTGAPQPGSPATKPLPLLGWTLKDPDGTVLMSCGPDGTREGDAAPEKLETAMVYIAKRYEEIA